MKPPSTLVAASTAAFSLVSLVNAATVLGLNTPTVITFSGDTAPTEFSTGTVGMNSGSDQYLTTTQLDAGVATVTAANVDNDLGSTGAATGTNNSARRSTDNGLLYTHPDDSGNNGDAATLLMATLANNSGGNIAALAISYDYARAIGTATETIPGLRVYYSLTGLANSWNLISALSIDTSAAIGTPDHPSTTVSLVSPWAQGTNLYVLWVDDNVNGSDNGYTIDNLSFTAVPEPSVALLGGLGVLALLRRRRD